MKIQSLLHDLSRAGQWVMERSLLAARVLLLVGIWGLAVFGWYTLGEDALTRRLPPVHEAAGRYAADTAAFLTQLGQVVEPLAADARLAVGMASEDGVEALDIRRAMYEFGYLNRFSQLYVWEEQSGTVGQLASSRPLPDAVVAWLRTLDETPLALAAFDMADTPSLYIAMHAKADATHVYLVMPTSWQALLLSQPRAGHIAGFAAAQGHVLAVNGTQVWMLPTHSRESPRLLAQMTPSMLAEPQVVRLPEGTILVSAPIKAFNGWAAAYVMPASVALGTSRMAQWLVIALAMLASMIVLWKPSRPIRHKALAKLAPLAGAIRPLTAPLVSSIAAVVSGQRQATANPAAMVVPGQFSSERMEEPQRRGRAMSFGGNYGAKPKPKLSSSNYMPMDAPSPAQMAGGVGKPSASPALAPSDDAMAELIDECLTLRRSQLLYQPIYQASNGYPAFHEVLLRLLDRDGQPISPGTFLPICDAKGWLDRLDQHVVERVLELNFAGGMVPTSPLNLNITGASMDSIGYLQALFEAGEAVMGNLVFEISSQDLLKDPKVAGFLREAKELGGRLAVDYFGGGVAMVEASRKLGFDFVKMNCQRFGSDRATKHELITLARATKRDGPLIVLEKVETVEMEVFARRAGVKYLQGYLMGKPADKLVTEPLPGWSDMLRKEKEEAANAANPADEPPPALPDSPSE